MNDDRGSSAQNWSFSELQRIDAVCDEFERAWTLGAPVAIEQLLVQNSKLPRSTLLDHLLRLELHLRIAAGESPAHGQYQQRFPSDENVISRVWQDFVANDEVQDLPSTTTLQKNWRLPGPLPDRIGSFQIKRFLGRGSFGAVYLAIDPTSNSEVALKVPHPEKLESARRLEDLWREFLTAKRLNHPNLVRTLKVENADGQLVIVQQFIDGQNLTDWYAKTRPTPEQVVRLLIPVAQALGYLHEQSVFHRDLKPGNILVDHNDNPYVADFGLALHEDQQRDPVRRGELAGTYAYMAPEQVRRQTQLIDGQTDLWSFGVILYRLLTDHFPFGGPPPRNRADESEYFRDLEFEIEEHDPRPPRQINPTVTRRLEQICLRCLEKRKRDRYQTGHDLAEDLRLVLERSKSVVPEPSRGKTIQIIPRGLRSFDATDAPFFLELLSGPRTLEGIPTGLNFWRNRLSDTSGNGPIDIGVVYGPSGCGKSSLVKAGLVPLLGDKFVPLVVESTLDDTEVRLFKALRKALPNLPPGDSLIDACRWVGEHGAGSGRKILLIFDQFEQWLHSHPSTAEHQFLAALRSCNGTRLQALLLVRDDFWMPLTRFMDQLEIPLQENNNIAAVDLFDCDHARKVLLGLGRAYGRLPGDEEELTALQEEFLTSAVEGLAEDRRIICVRLALFAEMMKDRPWNPAELASVGGAKGIGVAFLEEKFGPKAPAVYRPHRAAVRKVLEALLPPYGTNLKGQMKTVTELQEAVGSTSASSFEQLLRILDTDLKLLTPVIPDQPSSQIDSVNASSVSLHYQLTHDYLVPSVREWLATDLRRTRAGRAQLRLRERSDDWNWQPESRRLPSLIEWLSIWRYVPHGSLSSAQRRMMNAADRRVFSRIAWAASTCLLIAALAISVQWHLQRKQGIAYADLLVSKLQDVRIQDVPQVVAEMEPYRSWVNPKLSDLVTDNAKPMKQRIRAAVALLPVDAEQERWLIDCLVSEQTSPEEFLVVRNSLRLHSHSVAEHMVALLKDDTTSSRVRFRAACALAAFDSSQELWTEIAPEIAQSLLREPADYAASWIDAIQPVATQMRTPLIEALQEAPTLESARVGYLALVTLDSQSGATLVEILSDADGPRYRAIVELLQRDPQEALPLVKKRWEQLSLASTSEADIDKLAKRKSNLILALWQLGDRSLLDSEAGLASDPRVRTLLIHGMNPERIDVSALLSLFLQSTEDTPVRRIVRLALWRHIDEPIGSNAKKRLREQLLKSYRSDPDSETHSTAGLLLRKLKVDLVPVDRELEGQPTGTRRWFVNKAGTTMIVLDPRQLVIDGYQAPANLNYPFAIAATEPTFDEFREFRPQFTHDLATQVVDGRVPAAGIRLPVAAEYCNWLSRRDGIPEKEWCYPSGDLLTTSYHPVEGFLDKAGYRLPLSSEWEFACRAGTVTSRFFGEDASLMRYYGWNRNTSERLLQPVASLLPNPFGIFDMYGNAKEICIKDGAEHSYVTRGESCFATANRMTSSAESRYEPQALSQFHGLRMVKRWKEASIGSNDLSISDELASDETAILPGSQAD